MDNQKKFGKKAGDFLAGKGFPLVLGVCAAIIGLSAWYVTKTVSPLFSSEPSDVSASDTAKNGSAIVQQTDGDFSQYVGKIQREKEESTTQKEIEKNKPEVSTVEEEAGIEEVTETEAENDIPSYRAVLWPVSGEISKEYSAEIPVFSKTLSDWRVHQGVDIEAPIGTKVFAASEGIVKEIAEDDLYGTVVVIDHGDGLVTRYCNLAAVPTVQEGDWVPAGTVIGSVGETAKVEIGEVTHLHFEVLQDGEVCDPLDFLPEK